MVTPYGQGYYAGKAGWDERSCPYETTANINEWLNGYYDAIGEEK
jgi:ribosome modulation factor